MKHWKKWLAALLIAALAASLCLPIAMADDPAEDNGLEIEYEPVAPEAEGEDDAGDEDGAEPSVPASDGDGLEGTGLTLDDGTEDDAPGDDAEDGVDALADEELPLPTEQVYYPEEGLDEEAAAEGFINRAMYAQPTRGRMRLRAAFGYGVGSQLTGANYKLYSFLRPLVEQVAAGQRDDTCFVMPVRNLYENHAYTAKELGLDSLYSNGKPSAAAVLAFWDKITPDVGKVMRALMADCPYEMFWFDKTDGVRWVFADYEFVGDTIRIKNYDTDTVYFKFAVSAAYAADSASGTYKTNKAKIASVQTAANNARAIVNDANTLGDLEKLDRYRSEICSRVTYNSAAARRESDYGDPWQLVYVFDGDPSTNVVCEGYSKAFQYLCDMSSFRDNTLYAICVSGTMYNEDGGGGRHMWNLVHMGESNYLVDLTNCDAGTAGDPDLLFMRGYSYAETSPAGATYYYQLPTKTLCYNYDTNVVNLYGNDTLQVSDDPIGPSDVATSGAAGALQWSLGTSGVLYIRGQGPIPDYDASHPAPWPKDKVVRVSLSGGVTRIGAQAFSDCPNLEQITVPATVASIADSAFDNCPNMIGKGHKGVIVYSCACTDVVKWVRARIINHSVHHGENIPIQGRDPTCTQTGLTEGLRCKVCSEVLREQEVIPALGHKPVTVEATAPTCARTGLTSGTKCSVCGIWIVKQNTVPATGKHTYGAWSTTKAATCKATGTMARSCSVCGKTETQSIPVAANNHSWGAWNTTKTATCTSSGSKMRSCTVCGKTEAQSVPVDANNHSWGAWRTTRAATCTAAGSKTRACSNCGATQTQSIDATGHRPQTVWGYAATCTSNGLTNGSYCYDCNTWTEPQQAIPATGHSPRTVWGYAATCTASGLTDGAVCATCGATLTEQQVIPATGHRPQTVWGYAATCTSDGLTNGSYCYDCNTWTEPQQVIPATGHSPQTVWGYAATCTASGLTDGAVCATCGATLTEQRTIPATGHSPVHVSGYAATYFTTGLTDGSYCGTCGAWLTRQQVTPQVYIRQIPLQKAKGNGTVTMTKGENALLVSMFAEGAAITGYTSAKPNIATVDGSGIVTAKEEGKAKITVTTGDKKKKAKITIKVVDPYKPTGVSIAQGKEITAPVGLAFQLNATLAPAGAQATLTWTSSKANVATVDGNGWVTPLKEGKAKITVQTHNKKKTTITVKVVDPYKPTGVSIAQGKSVTIKVGQTLRLDAVLAPAGARSALTWTSKKAAVATVDGSGNVRAISKGKAKITVQTYNKKKATITVIVEE